MPTSKPSRHRDPDVGTKLTGGVEKRKIVLAESDPAWPEEFARHASRIRAALGPVARQVEHIGSTSVPGLAAKPIIDILVTVDQTSAEETYLQPLLGAGYGLRVRELGHRMLRTSELDVHVHVQEVGDPDAEGYLLFQDHLRANAADRALYEDTKRALVQRDWPSMNAYADAKTDVITRIKERAGARHRRAA